MIRVVFSLVSFPFSSPEGKYQCKLCDESKYTWTSHVFSNFEVLWPHYRDDYDVHDVAYDDKKVVVPFNNFSDAELAKDKIPDVVPSPYFYSQVQQQT